MERVAAKLDEEELLGLIKVYRERAGRLVGPGTQLSYRPEDLPREEADGAFLI